MGNDAAELVLGAAHADSAIAEIMSASWPESVRDVGFGPVDGFMPWEDGLGLLASAVTPAPRSLVPIAVVDDQSLACVVISALDDTGAGGNVVRWHLGPVQVSEQGHLLDVDPFLYLTSVAEELAARGPGYRRMTERIFPDYHARFVSEGRKPRAFATRPVRLACQNVVAGLAAFAHDSSFDGLSVAAWQTCELPHVATHEANRAMTALLLCEAFQSGGTMEIRFDRSEYSPHPEGRVPASLRRFARSIGVWLSDGGGTDARITPVEARELFLAVTPMPDELRERVEEAASRGHSSPERLCYTLMSQIWREIEVDFMLAVSARAHSILSGGASVEDRGARQAESDVARAASMLGMFYRRLDSKDTATGDGVGLRVLEDNRHGVAWRVRPVEGAVEFSDVPPLPVPWSPGGSGLIARDGRLTVLPRVVATRELVSQVQQIEAEGQDVRVVLPADTDATILNDAGLMVLACPDRLGELDLAVENRLSRARVARA